MKYLKINVRYSPMRFLCGKGRRPLLLIEMALKEQCNLEEHLGTAPKQTGLLTVVYYLFLYTFRSLRMNNDRHLIITVT